MKRIFLPILALFFLGRVFAGTLDPDLFGDGKLEIPDDHASFERAFEMIDDLSATMNSGGVITFSKIGNYLGGRYRVFPPEKVRNYYKSIYARDFEGMPWNIAVKIWPLSIEKKIDELIQGGKKEEAAMAILQFYQSALVVHEVYAVTGSGLRKPSNPRRIEKWESRKTQLAFDMQSSAKQMALFLVSGKRHRPIGSAETTVKSTAPNAPNIVSRRSDESIPAFLLDRSDPNRWRIKFLAGEGGKMTTSVRSLRGDPAPGKQHYRVRNGTEFELRPGTLIYYSGEKFKWFMGAEWDPTKGGLIVDYP